VLGRWGITLVSGDSDEPEAALTAFLEELWARVAGGAERERG
jgi:hypothetical protein